MMQQRGFFKRNMFLGLSSFLFCLFSVVSSISVMAAPGAPHLGAQFSGSSCKVLELRQGQQSLRLVVHSFGRQGEDLVELVWRNSDYTKREVNQGPSLLEPESAKLFNQGVQRCQLAKGQISTASVKVEIVAARPRCARLDFADSGGRTELCVDDMDLGSKTLKWETEAARTVVGLGQYMSEPVDDRLDWRGRIWEPGPYGNMMRGFRGGATANTQIPVVYAVDARPGSGRTLGLFFDHIYRQRWDFTQQPAQTAVYQLETWGDALRVFVFSRPDLKSSRQVYMSLTGTPPLPLRSQFGLWVSEFGYDNWQEMDAAIDSLRKKNFPLDGMAMDLQWYGTSFNNPDSSTMGSLQWDLKNFPKPLENVSRLQNDFGLTLAMIEQPYVADRVSNYDLLRQLGYLVRDCEGCDATFITYSTWWGRGGMLDFTNPQANDFWHDHGRKSLMDIGIQGHWADLGEPEMYHAWAHYHGFPDHTLHNHGDVHNIYALKWAEGISAGYRRMGSDLRPLILTRSGTAGVQRHGVAMWSGDIGANLASLQAQTRAQGHMSLSGIDYYGSDVGGFYRAASDGKDHELYELWFANASLTEIPVRAHVWNLDNKTSSLPSRMGHEASNLTSIRRRYSLLPYYYSLAYQAAQTGSAIVAPMIYEFPSDPMISTNTTQKMIGPSLMVALATGYGQSYRDVYLPAGTWYDVEEGLKFQSTGAATGWLQNYPLQRDGILQLPLFAKAGAIIPRQAIPSSMHNSFARTLDKQTDATLIVDLYAGANGQFQLYEDDGKTLAHERGEHRLTEMKLVSAEGDGELKFSIAPALGSFTGATAVRPLELNLYHFGKICESLQLNGEELPACLGEAGDLATKSCFLEEPGKSHSTRIRLPSYTVKTGLELTASLNTAAPKDKRSVLFVCQSDSLPPNHDVYLVGNLASLGAWQPEKALKMDSGRAPQWSLWMRDLPRNELIEWKCLTKNRLKPFQVSWQPGANNQIDLGQLAFGGLSKGSF